MEESEGYGVAEPVDPNSERYQEINDGFVDIEGGFAGSGGGDIEDEQSGEEGTGEPDVSADVGEHEARRDTANGDASSISGEQDVDSSGSAGSTADGAAGEEPLDVAVTGQPISVAVDSYEGVTADDFSAYAEAVEQHMTAQDAILVVLVVAVFLCAGIMLVDQLIRRFERF